MGRPLFSLGLPEKGGTSIQASFILFTASFAAVGATGGSFAVMPVALGGENGAPLMVDASTDATVSILPAAPLLPRWATVLLATLALGAGLRLAKRVRGARYGAAILALALVATPAVAAECLGDQDGDTDIDIDDISIILASRNQPAGPGERGDLDADGLVTVLDARIAAACCAQPLCVAGDPPFAAFAFSIRADNRTVDFVFTGSGSEPLTFEWDSQNDGSTDSTQRNPTYTYPTAGVWAVRLTVRNDFGFDNVVLVLVLP